MRAWPILILALSACGPAATLEEMYSGPWSNPTPDVMRVLAKNSVRGCGEFYQKKNTQFTGEYLVACNRMPDGSGRAAWVVYLVWTGTEQVQGPDYTAVYKIGPPRSDPR